MLKKEVAARDTRLRAVEKRCVELLEVKMAKEKEVAALKEEAEALRARVAEVEGLKAEVAEKTRAIEAMKGDVGLWRWCEA